MLLLVVLAAGGGCIGSCGNGATALSRVRLIAIGIAQTAMIAIILFMLWHPAMSVARLRPQQNVIAVLVDDSRSMGLVDPNGNGKTRLQNAEDLLNNQLVPELSKKFQIRLYSFGHDAARIDTGEESDARR